MMKPIVELEECLRDSPKFRLAIEEADSDIDQLEFKLDKLVKLCTSMIEMGKAFLNAKSSFICGIVDLSNYFKKDIQVTSTLNKLIQVLNEMFKYHSILIDQAHRSICKNMNHFIKTDIRGLKETRKCFEKISDEYDQALLRHAQVPRNKLSECEDANNNLTAVRSCFQHTALDYVHQISMLQSKKRYEVLDALLSFVHAKCTYFHQGSDLSQDIDILMKQIAHDLSDMRTESNDLEKKEESRHSLVSSTDPSLNKLGTDGIQLEGYLFKRTSNAFKTWNRRWFMIQNNRLVYRKRYGDEIPTIMEDDLRLCMVKPAAEVDRRFCFEVLSPLKSHMLQTDSEEALNVWLKAMQDGINAAIHQTCETNMTINHDANTVETKLVHSEPIKIGQNLRQQMLAIPGNDRCCDCKSSEPEWASINLGVTLCIECSGIHRSLGVHYSKVRSLTLDAWESEVLKIMTLLGNNVINGIYEAQIDPKIALAPDSNRNAREVWIKAKYIQKSFVKKARPRQRWHRQRNIRRASCSLMESSLAKQRSAILISETNPDLFLDAFEDFSMNQDIATPLESSNDEQSDDDENDNPNLLLHRAAAKHDLPLMSEALAHGADINWANESNQGKSAIHQAIESGSVLACEYLLLNGSKSNMKDALQRTPLHLATQLGNTGQVCLLLKRGADQHSLDNEGQDALAVAVSKANADIVTLLRLAKLNEEMRDSEFGNPDEMFSQVVQDFSKLASDNPEKLRRTSPEDKQL